MSEPKLTRINKYLSEVGYCSRRAADKLIEQRRVTINGEVPEMGTKIAPTLQFDVNWTRWVLGGPGCPTGGQMAPK